MKRTRRLLLRPFAAMTPSARTRHAELLRLCARIGYSPHASA
ncbi:capsid protein [Mesorhizobium microcysteis]|uniref:Capsid protein n=1 Tax=Neoaquamicrobium microcysteis TaxID=2682781 RepID=A0A5D4GW84_9HYPH|nr:capsid protein [Mesorhizobium microcysteis]